MQLKNPIGILLSISHLLGGAAAGYKDATVKTVEACHTEYCFEKIQSLPTYTRTIHTTTNIVITRTPKAATCYVTKTKTVKNKKTITVTEKCRTKTVYITRYTSSTHTVYSLQTITKSVNITTLTEDATTIPIPSGFLSAGDDPDNQYTSPGFEKRNNRVPHPTAVKCTKTIETIHKHTSTAKRHTTTVTKYNKTITLPYTERTTKTVCPAKAKTTTITRISTKISTTTKKTTVTVTKSLTAILPGFTTWETCGPHNFFPGATGAVNVTLGPNDIEIIPAGIAYECCANCFTHVNADGVSDCAGSFFRIEGLFGPGRCFLRLTNVCSYSHNESFVPVIGNPGYGLVSNGPCGRWKVDL
ncbi:hypothetical protein AA313_de0205702 [Arthrobotrys entomopaga]|nr:hypothetical protein AA313_de0205702 [Arthrobotrys entomopaga]